MKSKIELERDITDITTKIYKDHPELTKYISEMRLSNLNKVDVSVKDLAEYYNSLEDILLQYGVTHAADADRINKQATIHPGDAIYPPSEETYEEAVDLEDLNLIDPSKWEGSEENEDKMNEKDFYDDMSGDDLDIPGSELDDQQESVGSEDEENNYYSLGGDNHNDLEEDNG